jgi:mannobiose 2-epimerase
VAKSAFHFQPDWSPVTDPKSAGLSYGHNIEFAWLMVAAEEALKRSPDWTHFQSHLDHALAHGWDYERGGVYNRGAGNQPANDTAKVWWVQAEAIAAFTDGLRADEQKYTKPLDQTIHFVNTYQADKRDGVWLDTVTADGKPKSTGKAHAWKANYHDVRALVKFIEAIEKRK